MKIQEGNIGIQEKSILTGMIVHDGVCGQITAKWEKGGLFQSPWANKVASWCIRYYRKYGKAPNDDIVGLYGEWVAKEKPDKATEKLINIFLGLLSGNYAKRKKRLNPNYVLDLAGEHFDEVVIRKFNDEGQEDLDSGDISKWWERKDKLRKIEIGKDKVIDLSENLILDLTFDNLEEDLLIKYKGDLGEFYGDSFSRDSLVAFLAPEKRGKTFMLLDVAWRGLLARKKVAYFEVGDLSEKQIARRFMTRAMLRPLYAVSSDKPIRYPIKIISNKKSKKRNIIVKFEERTYAEPISKKEANTKLDKIRNQYLRGDDSFLKISIHANSSINVQGIRSILKTWEIDGFVPDIIVIDYADILAFPAGFHGEGRDAVNETWKGLRRMSQELHCLVVSATQTNALGYSQNLLGAGNFSEDKRKNAHVTAIYGINQSDIEKTEGLMRINPIVVRGQEYSSNIWCYVASCLAIANPCVQSYFPWSRKRNKNL